MGTDGKIVLMIARDVGLANMIRAILGIVQLELVHVVSGNDAVDVLKDKNTGLIICDEELPGMKGIDMLEIIRGNDNTKQIPFILLTSGAEPKVDDPAQKADRYIVKPFTARNVLDIVKEFVVFRQV